MKMHTKTSVWTLDETENKWYGVCLECKGEKAKHTYESLLKNNLKPCSTCTTIPAKQE